MIFTGVDREATERRAGIPRDAEPAGVAALEAIARLVADLPGTYPRLTLGCSGEGGRAAFDLLARLPTATIRVTVYPPHEGTSADKSPFVILNAHVAVERLNVEAQWSRPATPSESAFLREGGGKSRRIGEYSALAWAERSERLPEIS